MSEVVALVYYGGLTVLFFFWIYGIVSFALDIKNKLLPAIQQYRRASTRRSRQQEHDNERQEREEQLY
ncbi:hypothetical protein [Natronorubrum aibiense]|uniref:Uncharacterized protein n=1 Tax=Natronorubrum aibiense TaxID=348826 RepID=A0A5P9P027_9EURY|nr:hypothetical protein [Natronorubrum aibiense]QFU81190.1 hypothetical protein GCU68_00795 [Natronorubrum aibiense]